MTQSDNTPGRSSRILSVAPMMDCTDRHDRFFLRLISRHTLLYSEMVTAKAVLHGDRKRLLAFDASQHPVALQLGGADAHELARAARLGEQAGYDEINLNVGCPSDRVQSGRFGASLMREPDHVAHCLGAMRDAVGVPVTVKCRIGVDDQDGEASLDKFAAAVAGAGVGTIIVHARKAWLNGLSPKENRNIPPLDYERVYRLKQRRPGLEIILNGGVAALGEARAHLAHVDGVMIGRAAYQSPYILAAADGMFYGSETPPPNRAEIVRSLLPYIERACDDGVPLHAITRHILGLYAGCPGARAWRRFLSENVHKPGAGADIVAQALERIGRHQDPALVPAAMRLATA